MSRSGAGWLVEGNGHVVSYPNVRLGTGCALGAFVVLGEPPRGSRAGEHTTWIGDYAVIRSHTVIYAGASVGDHFQTGHHVLIREHTTIGNNCSIGTGSVVEFKVKIGDGVRLHSNVFVPEHSILEEHCWLGPNVVLTNAKYPAATRSKETLRGVTIGKRAKIGANATILPGCRIGADALVGAGALVSRDVEPGMVVAGNPATVRCAIWELRYDDTDEIVYPHASGSRSPIAAARPVGEGTAT